MKNPMNPVLMQAWNKGRQAGHSEATKIFNEFLTERMQSLMEIPGVGEKTAWKIHEHFLKGMDEAEQQARK